MDAAELHEAQLIANELRRLHENIDGLMRDTGDKRRFSDDEVALLQARLRSAKEEIKAAAKNGTISRKREPLSELESAFFEPAIRKAAARFSLAINANPRTTNWVSGLYDVAGELSYMLYNLEEYIAKQ